ncbi:MAG: NUDIX hydrolase [Sphaerochaetaceae bacterium]|nr:NUDIX hydrolase [Sphaerochaetaceae bacterium]
MKQLDYAKRRALLRAQSKRKGKGIINRNPHLIATNAILLIGDKWILIPRRAENTRFYKGQFHTFAGFVEEPKKSFKQRKKVDMPKQTQREIFEEIGIPKKMIEFLGPNFKPQKNPKALVAYHVTDTIAPDIQGTYLTRVKTNNPTGLINKYFEKLPNGELAPKKGIDKWEHRGIVAVELSSKGLGKFINENKNKIANMSLVMLTALLNELKRNRK